MFVADKLRYRSSDLLSRHAEMAATTELGHPEGKRYAACLGSAFDLLSLVDYLRKRGGSLLLLHADTPMAGAAEAARRAGCRYLLHGRWDSFVPTGDPKLISRTWREIETEIESYNR